MKPPEGDVIETSGIEAGGIDLAKAEASTNQNSAVEAGESDVFGVEAGGTQGSGAEAGGSDARGTQVRGAEAGGSDARGTQVRGAEAGGSDARGTQVRGAEAGGSDARGVKGSGAETSGTKGSEVDVKFAPWPFFDRDEIAAVIAVLASGRVNYWTGDEGRCFEREFADHVHRDHAVAVANGTVALETALRGFEIGPGDEVIVPARTYVATASCVAMVGAKPVVADVDPISQTLTSESIEAVITGKTRAIIVVHLAGWPCEMDAIMALAGARDLVVIEDCAQAHGAQFRGRPVGGWGHAAAFSFCQDKIMTTGGEGGMVVMDDSDAFKKAWAHKDIGRSYDAVYHRTHPPGFRWLTESFGTNGRLTEMQSAIGRIQLRKLPVWSRQRRENAAALNDRLRDTPGLRRTLAPAHLVHGYYKYYVFVESEALRSGWHRDRIQSMLNVRKVPCTAGSCGEIYREKAFLRAGWGPDIRLPMAKMLGETALMFQVHPGLEDGAIAYVGDAIDAVMRQACR